MSEKDREKTEPDPAIDDADEAFAGEGPLGRSGGMSVGKKLAFAASAAVFLAVVGLTVLLAVHFLKSGGTPEATTAATTAGTSDPAPSYDAAVRRAEGYIEAYLAGKELTVRALGQSVAISLQRANARIDYDAVRAFVSEQGGDPTDISIYRTVQDTQGVAEPELDLEYVDAQLEKLNESLDPGRDARYSVMPFAVIVHRGHEHFSLDLDAARARVVEALDECSYADVELTATVAPAAEPDWARLYREFRRDPVNARYSVDAAGNTVILDSEDGVDLDLEAVMEDYRLGDWEDKVFPGTHIAPEVTRENIDENLFQDVLGTMTTTFLEAEYSRSNNIRVATRAIDGTIVLPGYKFSFNNTVGERTEERGYMDALIYVNDGVEPGLGGGICQVSSTLYNAALRADLKQFSRSCHQFTVFYVDLGMDATVSWGNLDYIFVNSTSDPIKIQAEALGGKLTISILGTADYETKEIEFRNVVTEVYGYETRVVRDETLAPGTQTVKTTGRNGYRVETYRTVTVDGERYAEEWVATSIYDPLDGSVVEGPPLETTAYVTRTTKPTTPPTEPPDTTKKTRKTSAETAPAEPVPPPADTGP